MKMDGNSGIVQLMPDLRKRDKKGHYYHMHSSSDTLNSLKNTRLWILLGTLITRRLASTDLHQNLWDMERKRNSKLQVHKLICCHTPIAAIVWEENPRNHLNSSQTGQTFFPPLLISSENEVGGWDGKKWQNLLIKTTLTTRTSFMLCSNPNTV